MNKCSQLGAFLLVSLTSVATADNPFIDHMYTADPTARVMNGKLFVFPSNDVVCEEGFGNNGFCMPNYNVFSSENQFDWQDHGLIIDQTDIPWGVKDGFGMWAPDCIEKDGKFYFYYPDMPTDESAFRRVGVAIADQPEGPYVVEPEYIADVDGIDPNVFIDDDGQAYLYWGGGDNLMGAKLKDNMLELASEPTQIKDLPGKYKEGSFVFKRNGTYYFTFPHSPHGSEEIAYATGSSPLGPFEYQGKIMDRWTDGCWTNHHSVVKHQGQWMIFYHHHDISKNQHLRSVCADYLNFNADGSIQQVIPTYRGIGNCPADNKIQIDRYSRMGEKAIAVKRYGDYLPANWTIESSINESWVGYDRVDFGSGDFSEVTANCSSLTAEGTIEIRIGGAQGKLLASIAVEKGDSLNDWRQITVPLLAHTSGVQNIACVFKAKDGETLSLDWIRFN